jgi:hypothetical protein
MALLERELALWPAVVLVLGKRQRLASAWVPGQVVWALAEMLGQALERLVLLVAMFLTTPRSVASTSIHKHLSNDTRDLNGWGYPPPVCR